MQELDGANKDSVPKERGGPPRAMVWSIVAVVIAGVVLLGLVYRSGDPGLSDSLAESKRRGVFVGEYGVALYSDSVKCAKGTVCIHRDFPLPEEIWLEYQWCYGLFLWQTEPTEESQYDLFLKYSDEDINRIIKSGIPSRFRYATYVDEKKVGSKLCIPGRLKIFMHRSPGDTIRLFLDSRDEVMACPHEMVLVRKPVSEL